MADTEQTAGGAEPAPPKKGKGLWAPTRGYFEVPGGKGGAAKPAAKKAAPKKAAAGAGAPDAPAAAATLAPPEGAGVAASPPAAKAAAKPRDKDAARPAAPPPPKLDPERDSITTVPRVVETALGKTVGEQIYDAPDSETTLYRVPSLNVLFAVTSTLLLICTVWMVWDDYNRPWKTIQADWNAEQAKMFEKEFQGAQAAMEKTLAELEPGLSRVLERLVGPEESAGILSSAGALGSAGKPARTNELLSAARRALERSARYTRYVELRDAESDLRTRFTLREKTLRERRGDFQAAKFRVDERKRRIVDELGDTEEAAREIEKANQEFAEKLVLPLEALAAEVERLGKEAKEARDALDAYVKAETLVSPAGGAGAETTLPAIEGALEEISRKVKGAQKQVDLVEATWRNFVRNMPLFDFLAPTYKIEKVVLKDIHEDLNFETVPRIERCKTCHINIDSPEPGVVGFHSDKWGTVYASHPRLGLFVGNTSPHPYEKFGCTPCHQGDGHATDFITAAHTPEDEEEAAEWEKKYRWEPLHHQDFPMLQKKYVTGSCMKCHPNDHALEGGGSWNLGFETIKTYGCFGCHNLTPFKGADKVGPTLTYIGEKADLAWIYKWVRNPKHFRPTTRMPRFFDQTNTRGKMLAQDGKGESAKTFELDFEVRNGVEALAIATYLSSQSDRRTDLKPIPARGDAVRGRELFLTTGCLGCHSVKRESVSGDRAGEDLAKVVGAAAAGLDGAAARESPKPGLAGAIAPAKAALLELLRFYETLPVGRNIEALYHDAVAAFDALVKVDESLGAEGGAVAAARAAATAVYGRWLHNTHAPDLSSIGSKARSLEWLADWIIEPRRHDPKTTMPRFRFEKDRDGLGEERVADIVAYLMTLRDPEFEKSPVFSVASPEAADVLKDLAFDYKRRDATRAEALAAVEAMSQEEQLRFVGHRLIRRYGCYGCHNGIRDVESKKEVEKDGAKVTVLGTFDGAQPIGTDLMGWGWKMPAYLDYGNWGHQHSGREAIGHTRYDWAHAKLTDPRRFDVIPAEKLVAEGKYEYVPTNRLIQKTPEELLKMPRFPFAEDEVVVEAVVTFLSGLGKDRIPIEKTRTFSGVAKALEDGSRLIARLNCQGCHRIGAEPRYVHVSRLPRFSQYDAGEEDSRRSELEKETWLARDTRLVAYDPRPKGLEEAKAGALLKKGTLLGEKVFDTTTMSYDRAKMAPQEDEPLSVTELAAGAVNPDSKVKGHFAALEVPEPARTLPVAGFEEGRIRFYFGGDDPKGGADGRPMAPPPLVREGERVRSDWLFRFLLDVEEIRPWLKVRMPSFHLSQDDARLLVAWFKANACVPEANELFDEDAFHPERAEEGKGLFGPTVGEKVGLQCNSCHPAGSTLPTLPVLRPPNQFDFRKFEREIPGDTFWVVRRDGEAFKVQTGFADAASAEAWAKQNLGNSSYAVGEPWSKVSWGPDLGKAAARLRPTWIRGWLTEPWDFMPGTKMPHFFGDRDAIRGVHYMDPDDKALAGKVETNLKNIESLIQYLVHMKEVESGTKTASAEK